MFGRAVPSGFVAQLVEQAPLKREVGGSIPPRPIRSVASESLVN